LKAVPDQPFDSEVADEDCGQPQSVKSNARRPQIANSLIKNLNIK